MSLPRKIALITLGLVAVCTWAVSAETRGLEKMKTLVRMRFPAVPQLSTAELAEWLADKHRQAPVLMDVRAPAEFAVSHLPGARRVDPDAEVTQLAPFLNGGRPVVMYCSVGYRSSALAQRLMKAGTTKVYNLSGSIFQWANEGRPLERDGQPTTTVHPYNQTFGKLLDPQHRAARNYGRQHRGIAPDRIP